MGVCSARGCENGGSNRCSRCKSAWYCGIECQTASWPLHKTVCNIFASQREEGEQRRAELLAQPRAKPRKTHCTGCNVKFTRDYPPDDECSDCGYIPCESCACHTRRGSCYCENSNFGYLYCESEPQDYHNSSLTGKQYLGDRHPDTISVEEHPEYFEDTPRPCGNCKKVTRCLKLQYI